MLTGAGMLLLPPPGALGFHGWAVLTMVVVAVILFVTEPIPLPAVALLIVAGQVILLNLDSSAVAQSLMNDSVLFIMGSLMIAVALVKQKLDKRIAFLIVRLTGTKTFNVCLGISLLSGVLASFIGEHTVAAMMLPVALTLIRLTSDDPKQVRALAAVILFSICYGAAIGSIATPSGGARNAIMIGYWKSFFYDPNNPETARYLIDYVKWMLYGYPLFLVQVPFVTLLLFMTFRPGQKHITRAVAKLRNQVEEEGPLRPSDYLTIAIFAAILLAWILASDKIGLGTVALLGAAAFLVAGLVRWEEISSGVNWGVVLLYAAMISLGVQMVETGAALWVARTFLGMLTSLDVNHGASLYAVLIALTTLVTNTMSTAAAIAVLGPIMLKLAGVVNESPLIIGFLTALASSFAYLTVVSAPACTIVYGSGYLRTTDFLAAGWKMVVLSSLVCIGAAVFYWPLLQ
ncbi:MAG: DASS family sodium-coupled anion symporter [Rhizobiales bacterium]|nr:DASS family sodium-coupled anion symporter [Hyphomicrobiales bacterium]